MDTRSIKAIPNFYGNGMITLPLDGDKRTENGKTYTWTVVKEEYCEIGQWVEDKPVYEVDFGDTYSVFFNPAQTTWTIAPQGPVGSTGATGPAGVPAVDKVYKKGKTK